MSGHNDYPTSPERKTFANPEIVQFSDDEMGVGFRTKGDMVVLGMDYGSKTYAQKFAARHNSAAMAWVKTESGNRYGIAQGLIVNQNHRTATELSKDDIEITIGSPLVIPGVGETTDVVSVLFPLSNDEPNSSRADMQVKAPSPFYKLLDQVEAIRTANPQIGK